MKKWARELGFSTWDLGVPPLKISSKVKVP